MFRVNDTPSDQSNRKKYWQDLVVRYEVENRKLMANLIRAYAVLRYEFFSASMIGVTFPLGCKDNFNFFGLNPAILSEEQSQKRPTLLLHGACHNQGVWLYLAEALKNENLGPIFTVNFSCLGATAAQEAVDVIDKKIASIQHLYSKWHMEPVSVNIIGYSAGAIFAYFLSLDKNCWRFDNTFGFSFVCYPTMCNPNIHTVTSIGQCMRPSMPNMYEIVGKEDILVSPSLDEALQSEGKQIAIECGHLNLIRHPMTYSHISRILSRNALFSNQTDVQGQDIKSENNIEPDPPKKTSCVNRLFKNKKNDSTCFQSNESKSPSRSGLSCIIL